MKTKNPKPLGRKAYGSIPHLLSSRIGPGDHHCHSGQEQICLVRTRDKGDRVIVTEKLDGSNVAIANIDGNILALTRAGYEAVTSPYEQHHIFAGWVDERRADFLRMLVNGEVLHGEWLAQAHGTIYDLPHEPFVAFDLTRDGKRIPWSEFVKRCFVSGFVRPRIIHDGPAVALATVIDAIAESGHGVRTGELVEGAVWRVERHEEFDFMAKWVRPSKVDGRYLPEISGGAAIWNWRPKGMG